VRDLDGVILGLNDGDFEGVPDKVPDFEGVPDGVNVREADGVPVPDRVPVGVEDTDDPDDGVPVLLDVGVSVLVTVFEGVPDRVPVRVPDFDGV